MLQLLPELLITYRLPVVTLLAALAGTLWLLFMIRRSNAADVKTEGSSPYATAAGGSEGEGVETLTHGDVEPVFKNMPNFRQAGGKGLVNRGGLRIKDQLLFRSSRTDFLSGEEKAAFMKLGIKTIIDLRRKAEYERAEGEKILDDAYPPYLLRRGKFTPLKPSLRWGRRPKGSGKAKVAAAGDVTGGRGRRLIVNLMTMDLIWSVFTRINFFVRYLSLVLVVTDWLTGAHLFVKFFTWALLNRQTLADQYVDMVEHSKGAIADILRVVADPGNVPVLIHCAHGKDRTGMVVGLILACLEVEDDVIIQDYALSEVRLGVRGWAWWVLELCECCDGVVCGRFVCCVEGGCSVWEALLMHPLVYTARDNI